MSHLVYMIQNLYCDMYFKEVYNLFIFNLVWIVCVMNNRRNELASSCPHRNRYVFGNFRVT